MKRFAITLAALFVSSSVFAQCTGSPPANTVCAGVASGSPVTARFRALVPADLPATKAPTFQRFFTVGTFQYTSPTNPAPSFIRVRMIAGGGSGGGGAGVANGGNTTFADWTCVGGFYGGGPSTISAGQPGPGGSGGADGTGTLVRNVDGGGGQRGTANSITNQMKQSSGGIGALGGGFGDQASAGGQGGAPPTGAPAANSGAGGSGAINQLANGTAGGGGAGQYKEFIMMPGTYSLTVGAGGPGGAATTTLTASQPGSDGRVEVEEDY